MKPVKYPRTFHLPWSESVASDDKVIKTVDAFKGKRVIVTEKMDGENTTMYRDNFHARSLDSKSHFTRNWVKGLWASIRNEIPEGWRICGENLFAKHSIEYQNLPSYFMGISIWDEKNTCLSWDETQVWFKNLGIVSVPVLYDGVFDVVTIKKLWNEEKSAGKEGYVVRLAESIHYDDFKDKFAKFVRANHVNSTEHWMHGKIEINKIVKRS